MRFVTIDSETFRAFAEKSPYRSFMQTPEIAKYRESNGWTTYYLGVEEAGEIKATSMLVAKPTFLGKSTFLAPGGPLLDFEDRPLATFFLKHLKSYVKSHNGYVLHIDPYYELVERGRDGEKIIGGFDHTSVQKTLASQGFKPCSQSGQPKYLFTLDLNGQTADQIFSDMKRNTRGHIRKAEKQGVKIRELKREELDVFKKITESTSTRRNFEDKPQSYYEQMYDLFHEKGEVKFLLAEVKEQSEVSIPKHLRGTDSHFDNSRGRVAGTEIPGRVRPTCCKNDDREPSTLRNATSDCLTPLAAAMFILYGSEVIYLFSGSDEKYMKEYNAQYLIQWRMIKYAIDHQFKRYNFYGINGLPDKSSKDYGIYDFKKGFTSDKTGRVVELIGAHEVAISPFFYHLHQILSGLKKH